ncbi:hypothetical protein EDD11_004281 [Mortierella claussenii]|nr:hypothetical protein EDD11_004281 [Mortierella claussenii]
MSSKILATGIVRPAVIAARQQQQSTARSFSTSSLRLQEQQGQDTTTPTKSTVTEHGTTASGKPSYRSASYLLEITERQKRAGGRAGGSRDGYSNRHSSGSDNAFEASSERPYRRANHNSRPHRASNNDRNSSTGIPPSRFQPQPKLPYEATRELQFADEIDWEVTSVFEPRPLYANVAVGRGSVAPLGTIAVNSPKYNPLLSGTAISAHVSGVRSHGDLDPEVEQSLIQDLASIAGDSSKSFRKKSDMTFSAPEIQPFLNRLTHNFQEVLNPNIPINRFSNGGVQHTANITFEVGSDNASGAAGSTDQQAEKSWKRLERLGGDYTRPIAPKSLLTAASKTGEDGQALLDNVSQLIGQNQSIGLEDKKKFLKAIEKSLGSY